MEKNEFAYNYSAPEQEGIKKNREKYLPKEESKMIQLRQLDACVTKKGTTMSILVGTIGTLAMGTGMSLCLVWGWMALEICVGILGVAGIMVAYPLYTGITRRERERIAPEILRLTEELMK